MAASSSTAESVPLGLRGPDIDCCITVDPQVRGDMRKRMYWGINAHDQRGEFLDFHFSLGYVARTCSPAVVDTERLKETVNEVIASHSFTSETVDTSSPSLGPSFLIMVKIRSMEIWDNRVWMKVEITKDSVNEPFLNMINNIQTAVLLCLQKDKVANHHDIFFTSLHADLAYREQMPTLPITVKQKEGHPAVRSWNDAGFARMIANGTRKNCLVLQADKEWIFVTDPAEPDPHASDSADLRPDLPPPPDGGPEDESVQKRGKKLLTSIKMKNAVFESLTSIEQSHGA